MAGRRAAPKQAKPELAKRHPHQRKPKDESVTAVSPKTTEKDVIKLINSLAQWTRDLQAARSVDSTVPPRKTRSRAHARKGVSSGSRKPAYPRGNPLTESMEFTDRDGAVWLAYIEGAGLSPSREPTSATVLPERHLRFDCATQSRFTCVVPAGSPFLGEARLQSLLDEAQSELAPASTSDSSARDRSSLGSRMSESSTRALESSRDTITDWSRRFRQTASPSEALRRHVLELLAGASNSMHGLVEVLTGHRPARL
jgi:hypothetical protein